MRGVTAWKLAALGGLLVGASACDLLGTKKAEKAETKVAAAKETAADKKLCASNATYTRLKQAAFAEAKRIRERDTERLDALADASIVRMERPLLESRDEALDLTVCSGRMILELPPGAGAAFDGNQRLAADVTYSGQPAADGTGTVFKIDGGEPIIYRLASFDPSGTTRTASIEGEALDTDIAAPVEVEAVEPVVVATPAPAPAPARPAPVRRVEAPARTTPPAPATPVRTADAAAAARAVSAAEARAAAAEARAARAEKAAAAERAARLERVAEARRVQRGEVKVDAPRVERAARRADTPRADAPRVERAAARPSFNCRYAKSRVERQICGSEDLAARDRRMAAVYYRSADRVDPATRRALSASRLRFLAYRDRCGSEACIAQAYEDRIAEIRDIAADAE